MCYIPKILDQSTFNQWPLFLSTSVKTALCRIQDKYWRKKRQPTPVFLPGESYGQSSLEGYSPWGHTELDMTERPAHTHTHDIYNVCICMCVCVYTNTLIYVCIYMHTHTHIHTHCRRKRQSTPVFLPGNFHRHWSPGSSPWGPKELNTTEVT